MKNNNKIETLINTIVNAEVVEVSYNKYTRNAEIKVRIENSDIELKDVIFAQSTYSTNTTKAEKYADLFESNYTDTRRICKHISETVDFDKYNYCVEIEIKKSAKGTVYFVIRDYKRVEVAAEEAEAEAEVKPVEVAAEAEAEVKLAEVAAEAEAKLIDEQVIETLINKPVAEASEEFLSKDMTEQEAIVMYIAKKLDNKYEPQFTFHSENWEVLDADLDITYEMYLKADATWGLIADELDNEIDEEQTFASYVEARLDSRISLLEDHEIEQECRCAYNYQPEDFLPALCDGVFKHNADRDAVLNLANDLQFYQTVKAWDEVTDLAVYSEYVVLDGVEYHVMYYVNVEKANEKYGDEGGWDWLSFQFDIHFSSFVVED